MERKLEHASSLRVGSFVILDGIACKVINIETSKTGKHGHAKSRLTAVGIKDGQKKIKIFPGHDKVEVPIIEKKGAQVLSIQNANATVMDSESFETFDLKISEEFNEKIVEGSNITYWIILGEKVIMDVK